MIIDSHVHLPIEKNCLTLQQKKEKLLHDLKMNNVDKCIVITDSCMESAMSKCAYKVILSASSQKTQRQICDWCGTYIQRRQSWSSSQQRK